MQTASEVVTFWRNAGRSAWFSAKRDFDRRVSAEFLELHMAASRGELADWIGEETGALALLLLLDQFPRNMFRGSAHSYATDPLARSTAEAALDRGWDRAVESSLRPFFYLPFEHSEAAADQARAVALTGRLAAETGDQDTLKWARLHADIIARFGRFPHRNGALGRVTTAEEQAFLDQGGFRG